MKLLPVLCFPLLLPACQAIPSAEPAVPVAVAEGQALAQSSCGECHAVRSVGTSSNAKAPPFPVIVNQEGVTAETLSVWLRGAHNYPREMDFALSDRDVEMIGAYMLTLQDPNYKRPPD